jgi:hypothetical protein
VQNLTDERHLEFGLQDGEMPTEVGRSVYGKFAWQF